MLGCESKVLLLGICVILLLQKCHGEDKKEAGKAGDRMMMQLLPVREPPPEHLPFVPQGHGHMAGDASPTDGLIETTPVNQLLGTSLQTEDARRVVLSESGPPPEHVPIIPHGHEHMDDDTPSTADSTETTAANALLGSNLQSEDASRVALPESGPPPEHVPVSPDDLAHMPDDTPPTVGPTETTPVNALLGSYLQSEDAKRVASSRAEIDHYVHMLMDGLLEEWRPFHPHTDTEALQMVRDFLASRDINSDFTLLNPENANHEEWRERLKNLLIHYLKQPYVKENAGLQRAMKWYFNKLKQTIWVRRRLLQQRVGIARTNLVFSYLQALDSAVDQSEYRFDINTEVNKTKALKTRLEKLSSSPGVKMNSELSAAFKQYISKLAEALEKIKQSQIASQLSKISIKNVSFEETKPKIHTEKVVTYVDIVQDFIKTKKALQNAKDILAGKSLDRVGGIRTFLEYYLTTNEVQKNVTLSEAIVKFVGKLKKLPSHHLLEKHLKRHTIQKIITNYDIVYEYLSKLEWKRSGTPEEILLEALDKPDVQNNPKLTEAIRYYLDHSTKEEESDKRKRREVHNEGN